MWQLIGFMVFGLLLVVVVLSWRYPADKGAMCEDQHRERDAGRQL